MTILVFGATGNVGSAVTRALLADNVPVRAVVRDARRTSALPPGAEAVVADLNEPQSLLGALPGATGLFLLSGYRGTERLLAAAADAGVRHVVLLSAGSVLATDTRNALSSYHLEAEAAVTASGMSWTLLRPNSFMSNLLRWNSLLAAGNTVRAQFPDVAVSMVDPRDIAGVAVRAFEVGGNHAYRLTGPSALVPAEQVRILGEVLGRPLRCHAMTLDETRAELAATMPAAYATAIEGFFARGVIDETTVTTTVLDVTGKPPRSLGQWVSEHAHAFARLGK